MKGVGSVFRCQGETLGWPSRSRGMGRASEEDGWQGTLAICSWTRFPPSGAQRSPEDEGVRGTARRAPTPASRAAQIKPNANPAVVQTPRSDLLSTPAPRPPKVTREIEFDTIRLRSHVNAPQIGPAEVK